MAKIISRGKDRRTTVLHYRCECGVLAEYSGVGDFHSDRDGHYVKCPGCGAFVATSVLKRGPARKKKVE